MAGREIRDDTLDRRAIARVIEFAGRGLLLDVEGTTTSIAFVYETLFPYVKRSLRTFLAKRAAGSRR